MSARSALRAKLGCDAPTYIVQGTDPSAIGCLVGEGQRWTQTQIEVHQVYLGRPRLFTLRANSAKTAIFFHFGYVDIAIAVRNILADAVVNGASSTSIVQQAQQLCHRVLADEALVDGNVENSINLFCLSKTELPLLAYRPGLFLDLNSHLMEEEALCPWMFGLAHEFGHSVGGGFKRELNASLPAIARLIGQTVASRLCGNSESGRQRAAGLLADADFHEIAEEHIADICSAMITWNACGNVMLARVGRPPHPHKFAIEILLALNVLLLCVYLRPWHAEQDLESFGIGLRQLLLLFTLSGKGPLHDVLKKNGQSLPFIVTPAVEAVAERLRDAVLQFAGGISMAQDTAASLAKEATATELINRFLKWRNRLQTIKERHTVDRDAYLFIRTAEQLGRSSPDLEKINQVVRADQKSV
ncbi:hypothetical protein SAMN02990966_07456 [Rhodospirillales bacterium URHD0017]|nr:hypothetical protein SAMN02990966_07456 [Rhodospirillales bacterium URHD0017]